MYLAFDKEQIVDKNICQSKCHFVQLPSLRGIIGLTNYLNKAKLQLSGGWGDTFPNVDPPLGNGKNLTHLRHCQTSGKGMNTIRTNGRLERIIATPEGGGA